MADDLARGLLPSTAGGTLQFISGYITAWDPVTRENTVSGGAQNFVNLPCINPSLLSVGPVLLLDTPAAPIILGRIYRANPA